MNASSLHTLCYSLTLAIGIIIGKLWTTSVATQDKQQTLTTATPTMPTDSILSQLEINNQSLVDEHPPALINNEVSDVIPHDHATGTGVTDKLQPLLVIIEQYVSSDDSSLDELSDTESRFLQQIQQSPRLIDDLLLVYLDLPSGDEKHLLRSLLAATGSFDIEQNAIEHIITGDDASKSDWLALLRDLGVSSSDSRSKLFTEMPLLTEVEDLRAAILAITPQVVSPGERQVVLSELSQYINNADEQIRSAAIESLSKWADNEQAYIIEQALSDPSVIVRKAALFAAFSSKIQSESIKSSLLTIMSDSDEDWGLRMEAYAALKGYSLQGDGYDDFYWFHQQLQAVDKDAGRPKG